MPYVRKATIEDAIELSKNLKKEDEREVRAYKHDPEITLKQGIQRSLKSFSLIDNDNSVIAIFGVGIDDRTPYFGNVWLLCSPQIHKLRKYFIKHFIEWINELSIGFTYLGNIVFSENIDHINLLKWAGFVITDQYVDINDNKFIIFYKEV